MVENEDSLPDIDEDLPEEESHPVFTDEPEEKESLADKLRDAEDISNMTVYLALAFIGLMVGLAMALYGWYKSNSDLDNYSTFLILGLAIMIGVVLVLAVYLVHENIKGGFRLFRSSMVNRSKYDDEDEEEDDNGYYASPPAPGTPPAPTQASDEDMDEPTEEGDDELEEIVDEDGDDEEDAKPEPEEKEGGIIMPGK